MWLGSGCGRERDTVPSPSLTQFTLTLLVVVRLGSGCSVLALKHHDDVCHFKLLPLLRNSAALGLGLVLFKEASTFGGSCKTLTDCSPNLFTVLGGGLGCGVPGGERTWRPASKCLADCFPQ